MGQAFQAVPQQRLAQVRRQLLEDVLQLLQALGVTGDPLGTGLLAGQLDGDFFLDRAGVLLPAVIDDQVAGDAVEEGPQVADLLAGFAAAQAQPGFLAQVGRQFRALDLPREEAQQLTGVALELTVGGLGIGWRGHGGVARLGRVAKIYQVIIVCN
ncbi:hypothetical protein FQZ97_983970 [compost metagenome]